MPNTRKRLIDPTEYKSFLERYIKDLYEIDTPMIAGAVERCLYKLECQPSVDVADIADHLIANSVTLANQVASKWIPVTERLPDIKKEIDGEVYYRNVAVRVKNLLHERIAYYDPEHECWYDTGFFQIRGVTHWAELPEWED